MSVTTSISTQIVNAAVTALNASGASKPSGLTVDHYRLKPIAGTSSTLSVVAYPTEETIERDELNDTIRNHVLSLRFECRAAGDPVDVSLDPIYLWIVVQMMAGSTFTGLGVKDVREMKKSWGGASAELDFGRLVVDYEIEFWTDASDPSVSK